MCRCELEEYSGRVEYESGEPTSGVDLRRRLRDAIGDALRSIVEANRSSWPLELCAIGRFFRKHAKQGLRFPAEEIGVDPLGSRGLKHIRRVVSRQCAVCFKDELRPVTDSQVSLRAMSRGFCT